MLGCVAECNGCDFVARIAFTCFKLEDMKAPAGFWRRGGCPYATHVKRVVKVVEHKRVGQQKQKKVKA